MAQDQTAPPAQTTPPAKKKKKTAKKTTEEAQGPQFLTVPADAKKNPDGTYTYTDKTGRKWNYWKSPFGVMRSEVNTPTPTAEGKIPATLQYTSTTDKGDTVRFERQTPFGPVGYDRKKSEMSREERSLFELQHPESKAKPE